MVPGSIFVLHENVRIFDNKDNEIRLRRGIWNYEEAEIGLDSLSENMKKYFRTVLDGLCDRGGYCIDEIDKSVLSDEERELLKSVLGQLEQGNYIIDIEKRNLNRELSYAVLGYSMVDDDIAGSVSNLPKIAVFTDSDYAAKTASELSEVMKLDAVRISESDFKEVADCDLTTKVDGLKTEDVMSSLKEKYRGYSSFLVCLKNISTKFMHNLNRVALECKIPMVVSFLDGPMVSMLAVKPYDTGCFECFEARSMARIQDHLLYHEFEKNAKSRAHNADYSCTIPVMNLLMNLSMSESYLFAYYGASRFEGRLLSIFVPTLEIQVQDVLRVPFCHACGMVAKEQLKEKNISTRALIDNFVKNAISKEIK